MGSRDANLKSNKEFVCILMLSNVDREIIQPESGENGPRVVRILLPRRQVRKCELHIKQSSYLVTRPVAINKQTNRDMEVKQQMDCKPVSCSSSVIVDL